MLSWRYLEWVLLLDEFNGSCAKITVVTVIICESWLICLPVIQNYMNSTIDIKNNDKLPQYYTTKNILGN